MVTYRKLYIQSRFIETSQSKMGVKLKMKALKTILFAILITIAMAGIASAAELPLRIDKVEVDDTELFTDQINRLAIERGQETDVAVVITALEDISDVEVEVFISGFEYNDWERANAITGPKDFEQDVTYKFRFKVPISDEFEEDNYKLRVLVTDRYSGELLQNYNLKIDVPRHSLMVDDVVVNPEGSIKAGSALLVSARIENKGEKSEDDVKVTVKIPDLGVSATEYVNEIDNDDEEETEEIFVRIPRDAKPGLYDMTVDIFYGEGYFKETVKKTIQVTEGDTYTPAKASIVLGSQLESIKQGESAAFTVTITNNAKTSKSYTVAVAQPEWATIKITPSSTIVLEAEKTQAINIFVEANRNAPLGAQVITAAISSSGETLEQLPMTVNITKAPGSLLRTIFTVLIIVFIVILAIIGLIIGFNKLRGGEEEEPKAETYY